jgi:hypothetical protein
MNKAITYETSEIKHFIDEIFQKIDRIILYFLCSYFFFGLFLTFFIIPG